MDKIYAFADLPRTGLCNMLNVWARAFLWSKKNDVKLIAPNWVKCSRLGPWLRGERDKRYYFGQFTNDGYVRGLEKLCALTFKKRLSEDVEITESSHGIVCFSGQRDDILDFCDYSKELYLELKRIASKNIIDRLNQLPDKYIAVHIRRGDFKSIGLTLSDEYYLRAIAKAAETLSTVPILVFSDAKPDELSFLTNNCEFASKIILMPPAPALHDVLSLAHSSALVGTNGSSFSEWAAFLGRMPTFWSKDARKVDCRKCDQQMFYI